jgi:hypothetical protein
MGPIANRWCYEAATTGRLPRSRNARPQKDETGTAGPSFKDTAGSPSRRRPQAWRSLFFAPWTSQNAHDKTVLVRCAQ